MDDKQDSLSLLEKARLFRAQTPEKWEARKEERKQGHCELLGNQEALPYVKQYLEKQKISKKDLSQESSDEPRKIVIELKYSRNGLHGAYSRRRSTFCNVTDDEDNALSVYYSKKSDRVQSELMVSVVKGNNLFNNLQETESKSEKCCVCISLCPDHEKRAMKSQYRYLTLQGSVRWDHTFVFKGFSAEDLESRYIRVCIFGRSQSGKVFIGQAVIAGRQALVRMDDLPPRQPTWAEMLPLDKAVASSNETVNATLELFHEKWEGMAAVSSLVRMQANTLCAYYRGSTESINLPNIERDTGEKVLPKIHFSLHSSDDKLSTAAEQSEANKNDCDLDFTPRIRSASLNENSLYRTSDYDRKSPPKKMFGDHSEKPSPDKKSSNLLTIFSPRRRKRPSR